MTVSKESLNIQSNLVKLYNKFNMITAKTDHISKKRELVQ